MKSLHGVMHGGLWIRIHGLPEFSLGPPPRDHDSIQILRDHDSIQYFFQHDKFHGKFHNRFQDKQTPPSNPLKLIEFEIYYNKPNPLFFRQHNMRWTCNMVHSHFTLCLRAHDYIERLSQHPWYGLWMRVKGLHHYKVAALGSCVK
jgi:hypothetical protein